MTNALPPPPQLPIKVFDKWPSRKILKNGWWEKCKQHSRHHIQSGGVAAKKSCTPLEITSPSCMLPALDPLLPCCPQIVEMWKSHHPKKHQTWFMPAPKCPWWAFLARHCRCSTLRAHDFGGPKRDWDRFGDPGLGLGRIPHGSELPDLDATQISA